jgi:DNA repair photolyase
VVLLKVTFKKCTSALSKTGIYGVDYVLNPYTGCEHGCIYCYAVFMKRYSGYREEWGEFLDVKTNMPHVLRKEARRVAGKSILLSSVTDPYQGSEKEHEITRGCLAVLEDKGAEVSILTKSPLVLRDTDLLSRTRVGMTVTTADDAVARMFEPCAPPPSQRFSALRTLKDKGIRTYAFFGPILPYFSDTEKEMEDVLRKFQSAGVESVLIDRLNFRGGVFGRILQMLRHSHPELSEAYREILAHSEEYGAALKERVRSVVPEGMDTEILF